MGAPVRRRRPWPLSVVVGVTVVLVLGACGVEGSIDLASSPGSRSSDGDVVGADVAPTTTEAPASTTTLPTVDVEVQGAADTQVNEVAKNAIVDIESFWSEEYPKVFGRPYRPVSGGFFAFDGGTDPEVLPCSVQSIDEVLDNAFYCPPDDAVAWDQEGLMPDVAEQFGDLTVALVLAHEWGHVVQDRARITEPTVVLELQADCFAGAWMAHVRADGSSAFAVTTVDLDLALTGLLALRDAPGSDATDPSAHGSGFDRVGAFQDGYEDGAERCSEFEAGNPVPYQFPFSEDEVQTLGNMPLHDSSVEAGITTAAFESLDAYWAQTYPEISGGDDWEPLDEAVAFDPSDPPTCGGQPVRGFRLFLCVPDAYVGFDDVETIPAAYELGDFAVGFLFGTQYGMAVEDQLGLDPDSDVQASLWADCYAGAWAGALLPDQAESIEGNELVLSSGDLDEAVSVMLTFRTAQARQRQGPGFARVKAFRTGVVQGPQACDEIEGD